MQPKGLTSGLWTAPSGCAPGSDSSKGWHSPTQYTEVLCIRASFNHGMETDYIDMMIGSEGAMVEIDVRNQKSFPE